MTVAPVVRHCALAARGWKGSKDGQGRYLISDNCASAQRVEVVIRICATGPKGASRGWKAQVSVARGWK